MMPSNRTNGIDCGCTPLISPATVCSDGSRPVANSSTSVPPGHRRDDQPQRAVGLQVAGDADIERDGALADAYRDRKDAAQQPGLGAQPENPEPWNTLCCAMDSSTKPNNPHSKVNLAYWARPAISRSLRMASRASVNVSIAVFADALSLVPSPAPSSTNCNAVAIEES